MKYLFLSDLQHLLPTIDFIEIIYRNNSNPGNKYYKLCTKFGRISEFTVKIGLSSFLVLLFAAVAIETMRSILTGQIHPCFWIYFPFVHEYSTTTVVILAAYNYIMVVVDALTISPGDLLYFLIFVNILMMPTVLRDHLKELEEMLEKHQKVSTADLNRFKIEFLKFFKFYDDYDRFVRFNTCLCNQLNEIHFPQTR